MALAIEFPQVVWSIEFGGDETVVRQVTMTGGGGAGGGGVTVHNDLTGRSDPDTHPISSITGLSAALAAAGNVDSVNGQTGTVSLDLDDLTDVDTTTDPPDADDVLAWDGVTWTPATLTALGAPGLSNATPADLGTAAAGVSTEASRADHVHAMPTAADVGADAAGAAQAVADTLGTAATKDVGTTAGTVAAGDDARLSDARTPVSHNHAASEVTSGTLDIARIPTGTTSTTVPLGNDSRFTDSRTPTAHASSHAVAGSDPVTLAQSQVTNLTTDLAAKVPTTRTVNSKALSSDITLTASDVGAQPADTDLTTLAGLTPTTDSFIQAKSSAWAARTIDQVKSDLGVSSPPLFITAAINEYVGMPSPNVASQGIANYVLGAAGRGNISPIWLPAATYDRIGVYVPTGGTATLRLGLYTADATTGLPGTKVFDAGTISAASTGFIEATISQTLSTGWYWAAVVTDAYTSTFELMGFGDSSAPTLFGSVSATSAPFRQRVALFSSAWTTGGLTTSPPTLAWASAGVKVVLRRSA